MLLSVAVVFYYYSFIAISSYSLELSSFISSTRDADEVAAFYSMYKNKITSVRHLRVFVLIISLIAFVSVLVSGFFLGKPNRLGLFYLVLGILSGATISLWLISVSGSAKIHKTVVDVFPDETAYLPEGRQISPDIQISDELAGPDERERRRGRRRPPR